jgi:hypothetical protein
VGSVSASRSRGKLVVALVLGALVVGGGVLGALAVRSRSGYQPIVTSISGFRPAAGGTFGTLVVETSGKVAPAEVASHYEAALASLRERAKAKGLDIPDPLHELVAVPQLTMCEPSAYLDRRAPEGCARAPAVAVIGPRGQHRLLVVDEPARLAEAIVIGVADAACMFDPGDRATEQGQARWTAVCEITEELKSRSAP